MRGFSRGEEKGIVVLVASSEAAMDLSYSGQTDVEEAGSAGKASRVASEGSDSDAEQRQQRRRRQQQQQRYRQQRKRRRDDSDEDGGENCRDVKVKVEAETALIEPSGQRHVLYPEPGQDAAVAVHQFPQPLQQLHQDFGQPKDAPYPLPQIEHPYHEHGQQQLRSHPVHAFEPSPNTVYMERHGTVHASVRAHALSDPSDSSAALLYRSPHDDAVSTLDVAGAKNEIAVGTAIMPVGRRGTESGGGQGRGYILHPFDQHVPGASVMGLVGFGRAGGRDGNSSLLINTLDVERRTMHTGGGPGAVSSMDTFDKNTLGEGGMGLMGFGRAGSRCDGFNGLLNSAVKVERRTVQISCAPGPGSIMYPFDRHSLGEGGMGLVSFGRVGSRCDGSNGLLNSAVKVERRTVQISCAPGSGSIMYPFDRHSLGEGAMGMMSFGRTGGRSDGFNGLLNNVTPGQQSYLLGPGLVGPDAGVLGIAPEATHGERDDVALQNAALTLVSPGVSQHRDNLPDLFTSSFSPGQLQVLTGQPHLPVGSHPQLPQVANGWGHLPLDSDNASPRQQFAWGAPLGL
ncbi:hypothetical protein Vretimale_7815 [Volvox reticuliferus]|nr:hypothetical protein Vretimale_7815 [Volvox reticuliferus]